MQIFSGGQILEQRQKINSFFGGFSLQTLVSAVASKQALDPLGYRPVLSGRTGFGSVARRRCGARVRRVLTRALSGREGAGVAAIVVGAAAAVLAVVVQPQRFVDRSLKTGQSLFLMLMAVCHEIMKSLRFEHRFGGRAALHSGSILASYPG